MMAALFLLMTLLIGLIYAGKHAVGIVLLIATIGLCWLMLGHHATNTLQISL